MTKLFVGGLSYSLTDKEVEELFAQFGAISSVFIATDKFTGRSRGFAFVEMEDDNAAQTAISQLNNTEVAGRNIIVSVARPKEEFQGGGNNFRRDNRDNRGDRGGRR